MKMLRAVTAALLLPSAAAGAQTAAQNAPTFAAPEAGSGVKPRPGGASGRWLNADRPRDRERWRKHCGKNGRCGNWDYHGFGFGYGYGGLGHQDMMAGGRYGYFSQGGEARALSNGRPVYDYDRGYPYEYYREGARAGRGGDRGNRYARGRECSLETTRDRRTGREVDIRVCRN